MATLFGPSPAEVLMARQKEQEQMYMLRQQQIGQQGGQFGVFAPLYQAGLQFGDIGAQAMRQGLFPQQADPALMKATAIQGVLSKYAGQDMQSADVLRQISKDLMPIDPDASIKALTIAKSLRPEKEKLTSVAPGSSVIDEQGNVLFTAPDRPAKDTNPTTASEIDYLTSLQSRYPDTAEGKAAAANEFAQWKSSFRQREAAAGVPGAGEVKVTDIASATGIVDRFVKDPKDRLSTANSARTQLNLAKQGSGPAFAQLKRQLVKLVGDSQIGQGEVRDALGRAGIVGDTIDAVNTFLTGVPSRDKLGAVEQVINALEEQGALSYNEGRAQAERVLNNAKLTPSTVKDLIPPPYKTAREKAVELQNKGPAVGAVQSGYRFKGGDPANKNNWEKVQ
jgi:hypothetical protein